MYEIILYDTEDGKCPMQELLDSLEPKLLAKTLRSIDLLDDINIVKEEPKLSTVTERNPHPC